jgi:hypothetical protein
MAQKPLSPEGGSARVIGVRFPHREYARMERAAKAKGCSVSEYVRRAIAAELATDGQDQEVAEAS